MWSYIQHEEILQVRIQMQYIMRHEEVFVLKAFVLYRTWYSEYGRAPRTGSQYLTLVISSILK